MFRTSSNLKARLEKVWTPPDFTLLFEKIIKRPPHIMKKGSILFNEGDPLERLYYIKDGFVKLYRLSEDGKDATSYLIGPKYVIGVRALLTKNKIAQHNAEAITDINVVTISDHEYFDLLQKHPEFLIDLLHVFTSRLLYTERKLEGFMFADATARTANFLTDAARRFGVKEGKTIHLPLALTHQRIADFVGSTRETVTISINRLVNKKIITADKGNIIILNIKKLNDYALVIKK